MCSLLAAIIAANFWKKIDADGPIPPVAVRTKGVKVPGQPLKHVGRILFASLFHVAGTLPSSVCSSCTMRVD